MAFYSQGVVNQVQQNLDLATVVLEETIAVSTSTSPSTFYCNSPADTFSGILSQVALPNAQIVMSSGTFSEMDTIDLSSNDGLAIICPACVPPLTRFAFNLTTTAPNVRLAHLEILGEVVMTSANSNSSHCLFSDTVLIGQNMNRDITIENCSFTSGKPVVVSNTFAPLPNSAELLALPTATTDSYFITNYGGYLYMCNYQGGIAKADAITGVIISTNWSNTADLGQPTGMAVDAYGFLYVSNAAYIYKYDTAVEGPYVASIETNWPTSSGMVIDNIHSRLYLGATNGRIMTFDISGGTIVQTADLCNIGSPVFALAIDNAGAYLYASASRVVKVLISDGSIVADPFISGAGIAGLTYAVLNGVEQLYVGNSVNSEISIYNANTGSVISSFWKTDANGLANPTGLTASNAYIYACNNVLDLGTFTYKLTVSAFAIDEYIPIVSFYNCDFQFTSLVFNQPFASQVIIRGCQGIGSFNDDINATFVGVNTSDSLVQTTTNQTIITGANKQPGYVYTAGEGSGFSDTWSSVLTNPATLTLDLAGNQIVNASSIKAVSSLTIYTQNDGGQVVLQSNSNQIGDGISPAIQVSPNAISLGMHIGAGSTDYRGIQLNSANDLNWTFGGTNNTQHINNLAGTTTSKNLTLTNGEGGVLTFQDGTIQETASVAGGQVDSVVAGTYIGVDSTDPTAPIVNLALPSNTVSNNMLISSDTGVLSWTAAPVAAVTFYCNQSSTPLDTILTQVGSITGAQIIFSSGVFYTAAPITVSKTQCALVGPNCSPPLAQINSALTVDGTQVFLSHLTMLSDTVLSGNSCRYTSCDFLQNVTVGSGSNSGYITLESCEFIAGKTITVNATGNTAAIYFINCNFAGATLVVNSASPLQVIINNSAGFLALPSSANATLVGINVLASGVINNAAQRTILAAGRGTASQVLATGGSAGNDTWVTGPFSGGTYYVNDGVNDLSTVLAQVGAQQGAQIIISSGSFGGDAIVVSADNLAIVGPNCVPAIVELIRAVTVSGTRIRMVSIQFDGVATLTGNSCRYSNCDFTDNVTVGSGSNSGYITLESCEFIAGKTITVNATGNSAAIYFINCNFAGATLVVNSASPLQVIINNSAGFLALPSSANATLVGVNVLASGVINNVIQRTVLASGRGTAGNVLISGGSSGNDTWGAVPSDPLKYDVAGGTITGDVVLSATKSLSSDIINIKTLTIGSPQYITAATGVINATVSVTKCAPGLFASQALTIANGTVDGFVKVIEIINTKPIAITGANLHSSLAFTTEGQGAILVWDNDSEFWIVSALNNGAGGGGGGGQVNSVVAGTYIGVDSTDPVNPVVNLALPACDTDGKVLSSLTDGTLSWITAGGGGTSYAPVMFEVWVGQDYALYSSSTTTDSINVINFFNKTTAPANNNGAYIESNANIKVTRSGTYRITMTANIYNGENTMLSLIRSGVSFYSGKGLSATNRMANLTGTWLLTVNDFDSISFGAYTSNGDTDGWGGAYYQRPGFNPFNYPIVSLVVDLVS